MLLVSVQRASLKNFGRSGKYSIAPCKENNIFNFFFFINISIQHIITLRAIGLVILNASEAVSSIFYQIISV